MARPGSRGPIPKPILERVAAHTVAAPTGCVLWTGTTDRGRPRMQTGSAADGTRRARDVHVLVWEAHHGPAPAGFDIHHDCEVKLCVNIEHLILLTHGEHSALHSSRMGVAARSARASYAMHVRWHVNRGRTSDACPLCHGA